jgi:hypothetical protein
VAANVNEATSDSDGGRSTDCKTFDPSIGFEAASILDTVKKSDAENSEVSANDDESENTGDFSKTLDTADDEAEKFKDANPMSEGLNSVDGVKIPDGAKFADGAKADEGAKAEEGAKVAVPVRLESSKIPLFVSIRE